MTTWQGRFRGDTVISFALVFTLGIIPVFQPKPGDLDLAFGGDGKVITDLGTLDEYASAMTLDSLGRILVAGTSDGHWALARYNPDGSLDTSFDGDGKVTTSFAGHSGNGRSMAIDRLGRIVVAGQIYTDAGNILGLARYNPNGALDVTFSGDGWVTTNVWSGSAGEDRALDASDRIVVAVQSSCDPNCDFAVARYTPDGSLDASFNRGGIVITDFSGNQDSATAVAVDGSGHIVVAGSSNYDFALARYHSDGSRDSGFGSDGRVTTDLTTSADWARALTLDSVGRIIVVGGANHDFAVVRYLGGEPSRSYLPLVRRR